MNRIRLWVLVSLLTAAGLHGAAQDPAFSQPYLSPIYLNPAATGAGENDLRVSLVHRRQWLTIPSQFNYTALSIDKFFPSIKGGLGLMATDFSEGYLRRTGIYGSYSYTICSGEPNIARNDDVQTWFVTGGIQFGMVQRRIDYSKLLFADQINENGIIPGSVSAADPPVFNKKWYPDFSGGVYFSHEVAGKGNLLIGASARHINRPDESLTSTSDTFRSPVPVLWGLNTAYQYDGDQWVWGVAMLGYKQGGSQAYQFGVDVKPKEYDFSLGVWAHFGNTLSNFNAVCLNITYSFHSSSPHKQKFVIGLDQDFPVGGSGSSYTTGSTELGLTWDYNTHGENADSQETDNRCKPRINLSACPAGAK
ncbi:MAG: PorP/SprF family type IX secretion system membrane protein [Chitinophagaceae bacterium]|nr:PorP/SprF family type IX secretion system membrane protein [Chitinophagaceae bacterium]